MFNTQKVKVNVQIKHNKMQDKVKIYEEKKLQRFAKTNRLYMSAIPYMQRTLNKQHMKTQQFIQL